MLREARAGNPWPRTWSCSPGGSAPSLAAQEEAASCRKAQGRSLDAARAAVSQASSQSVSVWAFLQLLLLHPQWKRASSQASAFTCFPDSCHSYTFHFTQIPSGNFLGAFLFFYFHFLIW